MQMRQNRRLVALGCAVAGLLLLGVGLGVRYRPPVVRLADGSTIALRAVTVGTNHLAPPLLLNRMIEGLPSGWRSRLGFQRPNRFHSARPRVLFWLVVQPGDRDSPRQLGGDAARASLLDAHGIAQTEIEWLGRWSGDSDRFFEVFGASVFPRRQPWFIFRLAGPISASDPADGSAATPPLDFRVRNPLPGPWPDWDPAPLPCTIESEGVEFSLVALDVDLPPRPSVGPADSARGPLARASFAIVEGGRPAPDWTLEYAAIEDATGNSVPHVRPLGSPAPGESEAARGSVSWMFPWPLWLDEPAYRTRFEFVRAPDAAFPPQESCELRGVPVPRADGLSLIGVRTNLSGFPVSVLALVGEQATLPGREHDVFGLTTLEVEIPMLPEDRRFDVVRIVDDLGRPAEPASGAGRGSYGFRIPEGARTVDIRIALTRRRVAEFIVRPTVRRTGGSARGTGAGAEPGTGG